MVDNDCKPRDLFHREFGLLSTQNEKDYFLQAKPFVYESGI